MPQAVLDALEGVDVILHAGDVDDPAALEPLRAIAPVHAVRGNFHILELADGGAALPSVVELDLAGRRIVLVHGHRPGPVGFFLKGLHVFAEHLHLTNNAALNRRATPCLARLYPEADVIVFGHSHKAHVQWIERTLLVNPGAVFNVGEEPSTVALMRLGEGKPTVEIVPLGKELIQSYHTYGGKLWRKKTHR
jgi:putative phosphoesterase